jgi:hypothetical protein
VPQREKDFGCMRVSETDTISISFLNEFQWRQSRAPTAILNCPDIQADNSSLIFERQYCQSVASELCTETRPCLLFVIG